MDKNSLFTPFEWALIYSCVSEWHIHLQKTREEVTQTDMELDDILSEIKYVLSQVSVFPDYQRGK